MRQRRMVWLMTVAVAGGVPCLALAGQDTRALIERALDEPASIMLVSVRLADAIDKVTAQTGVRIVMPPSTLRLAPYGGDTLIERVEIANMSLRQGLTDLLTPLGMTFELRDDHLEIVPKEALRVLGRSPTWSELGVLTELATMHPGLDEAARAGLRSRIRFEVPVRGAWRMLSGAMGNVGAGAGDQVLGVACRNFGWVWYPEGDTIVVVAKEQLVLRNLKRPISLRLNSRRLIEVLQAIGRQIDVTIRIEPGGLTSIPPHVRGSFSVNVQGQTAGEVLDQVASVIGLGYLLEPDGVLFFAPGDGAGSRGSVTSPPVPARDPYVAKMVVSLEGGKTLEWLIRRSELPPDLRERRARDLAELFEAVRKR